MSFIQTFGHLYKRNVGKICASKLWKGDREQLCKLNNCRPHIFSGDLNAPMAAFVANSFPSVKLDEFEATLRVCYLIIMTSRAPETLQWDFYREYLNFSTCVALVYWLGGPVIHAHTPSELKENVFTVQFNRNVCRVAHQCLLFNINMPPLAAFICFPTLVWHPFIVRRKPFHYKHNVHVFLWVLNAFILTLVALNVYRNPSILYRTGWAEVSLRQINIKFPSSLYLIHSHMSDIVWELLSAWRYRKCWDSSFTVIKWGRFKVAHHSGLCVSASVLYQFAGTAHFTNKVIQRASRWH